jgi:hypothetical protein
VSDKLQKWIEKQLGRRVERTADGFLVTRAELDILARPPKLKGIIYLTPSLFLPIFGA